MIFDARVQALAMQTQRKSASPSCTQSGSLLIPSDGKTEAIALVFAAGTNYDQKKGNAANDYSFKGVDPEAAVLSTVQEASKKAYEDIYSAHVTDHGNLFRQFTLDLPDPDNSANVPTPQLMTEYTTDAGDPFVESLLFDYGRYLFIASSRPGSLPPNLQGIWTESLTPAWSADYHLDVNVQM
jgi:alpha-L-fucosidase 2